MKYLWTVVLALLCLQVKGDVEPRTLLVVGDSLSAAFGIDPDDGWVSLLQLRLAKSEAPWRVVNASISGDTTAGGLSRLPGLLRLHRPDIVVIALGSNDGLRALGFEQIRQNLTQMIGLSRAQGASLLLVGGRLPPNYGASYTEAFHELFHEIAAATAVPLVPFLLQGVAEDRSLMQADGYHPTARAQPQILENVWPLLSRLLGDQEGGVSATATEPEAGGAK